MQDGDVLALDFERRRFWFVGPSNNEIVLSMPVMIASHQPFAEPSFSQYFAMTWEPTRNASQGLLGGAALVFSGLLGDAAAGFATLAGLPSGAVAGAEEVA